MKFGLECKNTIILRDAHIRAGTYEYGGNANVTLCAGCIKPEFKKYEIVFGLEHTHIIILRNAHIRASAYEYDGAKPKSIL